MNRVFNRKPWLFDNHLLSLKQIDGNTPSQKIEISTEEFWVLFHNLPLGCMNPKMGQEIANTVGIFKNCEVHEDGFGWGLALRVLIEIELNKAIARAEQLIFKEIVSAFPSRMRSCQGSASSVDVSPMPTAIATRMKMAPEDSMVLGFVQQANVVHTKATLMQGGAKFFRGYTRLIRVWRYAEIIITDGGRMGNTESLRREAGFLS